MKNSNCFRKLTIIFMLLLGITTIVNSQEQEAGTEKTITIKIMGDCNGQSTNIDTSIHIEGLDSVNINGILNSLNIELPAGCNGITGGNQNVAIDVDALINGGETGDGAHVKCIKKIVMVSDDEDGTKTTSPTSDVMTILKNIGEEGESKMIKMTMEIGEDGKNELTIIDEDGNLTLTKDIEIGEDGKTIIENGEKKVVCIMKSADLDVINSNNKDCKAETVVKVEVDDNGNVVKNVYITEGGELQEISGDDVHVEILENCNGLIVIANISIEELTEEDTKNLEDSGINTNAEELKVENLNFYPNPNDGRFNLKFELQDKGDTYIKVFDMNGKTVYKEKLRNFTGEYNHDIDITESGKGVYFLNVNQEKSSFTKKLIIQ